MKRHNVLALLRVSRRAEHKGQEEAQEHGGDKVRAACIAGYLRFVG
jgi:hypothetical protein